MNEPGFRVRRDAAEAHLAYFGCFAADRNSAKHHWFRWPEPSAGCDSDWTEWAGAAEPAVVIAVAVEVDCRSCRYWYSAWIAP